jgi:hypothetical protein
VNAVYEVNEIIIIHLKEHFTNCVLCDTTLKTGATKPKGGLATLECGIIGGKVRHIQAKADSNQLSKNDFATNSCGPARNAAVKTQKPNQVHGHK